MQRLSILLILAVIAACSDSSGFAHISMVDNQFSPKLQKIPVGGQIEFVNKGDNPHNAIATDKKWGTDKSFGNIVMKRGDKSRITFPEKGVFPYLCSFHASPDGKVGMTGTVVVGDIEYNPSQAGRKWKETNKASGRTRRVPQEYPTIQNAVDAAEPGDLVLIGEGVYKEEVVVTTPSIVLRGVDRNKVIIDGEFARSNGIMVMGANGVAIENMTAQNATLNGFFWTGVNGYRASYVTAINNGDYGVYAFDSVNGVFEHSYGSGSPDSSYYVGQCYPCKAILHNLIGEESALGYSGTNSGGELYIVQNVFRKNILGIGPNTLDSELLPPERETTIRYNLILDNGNEKAPIKPLTWPSFGNGIMVAGGLRNIIEKNIIVNHPNHGVLVIPNLQENLWLSHDNVIRENTIINSGRADIALVGPVAVGNCFSGNDYLTTSPFGLQLSSPCSGLREFAGSDLSVLMGGLAMVIEAKTGLFKSGDYKTRPRPGPQPEMPDAWKKTVEPAHNAFESRKFVLEKNEYPEEAKKVLAETKRNSAQILGSVRPLSPVSPLTLFFHVFMVLMPVVVYAGWTALALVHLTTSGSAGSAKAAFVVFVPYLGAMTVLIREGSSIPGWLKKSALWTGGGLFGVILVVALVFIL